MIPWTIPFATVEKRLTGFDAGSVMLLSIFVLCGCAKSDSDPQRSDAACIAGGGDEDTLEYSSDLISGLHIRNFYWINRPIADFFVSKE